MSTGGLAGWTERLLGGKAADISPDLLKLGATGSSEFGTGTDLTNEGLGDLRSQQQTYSEALKNPLGTGPNSAAGIFARARGGVTDLATRSTNTLGARLSQQAKQNGGNLSPEAQAELTAENQRDTNQNVFESNTAISNAEASATLSETSKLFDRMDAISKTILGVGADERTQGLQALIASLGLRYQRNAAIASTIVASMGKGGINTGTASGANGVTGAG